MKGVMRFAVKNADWDPDEDSYNGRDGKRRDGKGDRRTEIKRARERRDSFIDDQYA